MVDRLLTGQRLQLLPQKNLVRLVSYYAHTGFEGTLDQGRLYIIMEQSLKDMSSKICTQVTELNSSLLQLRTQELTWWQRGCILLLVTYYIRHFLRENNGCRNLIWPYNQLHGEFDHRSARCQGIQPDSSLFPDIRSCR